MTLLNVDCPSVHGRRLHCFIYKYLWIKHAAAVTNTLSPAARPHWERANKSINKHVNLWTFDPGSWTKPVWRGWRINNYSPTRGHRRTGRRSRYWPLHRHWAINTVISQFGHFKVVLHDRRVSATFLLNVLLRVAYSLIRNDVTAGRKERNTQTRARARMLLACLRPSCLRRGTVAGTHGQWCRHIQRHIQARYSLGPVPRLSQEMGGKRENTDTYRQDIESWSCPKTAPGDGGKRENTDTYRQDIQSWSCPRTVPGDGGKRETLPVDTLSPPEWRLR